MKNKINGKLVVIITLFLCLNCYVNAADDVKWYEDRDEALTLAKEQNKYVLLLYGRTTCGNCAAAKKFINEAPINAIVQQNFILWFCNVDIPEKKAQASVYRNYYDGGITFPLLCVINPQEPIPALSYTVGYKTAKQIEAILNNNMPTSNQEIDAESNIVYLSDQMLTISNNYNDETIYVYTISGQLVDSFDKKDFSIIRNAYAYPKGLLLISSSKRWDIKVYN